MTKLQEKNLLKQALKNKNFIKQLNKDKQKAKIKRLKSLGSDPSLLFLPIISEMILQKITEIGNTFSNLDEEIEQLNEDIVNNTSPKQDLINRKNALLNQINFVENKIDDINKLLSKLDLVIKTFQLVTITLKTLPLPTAPVPLTAGVINTFGSLLEKANKIITSFKAIIQIVKGELQDIKSNLEDIKSKIKLISDNIENEISASEQEQQIYNNDINIGVQSETYNGFKFAIREETNTSTTNGPKRHYAVAIDGSGIEVLKTELSYTLDTQTLLDFLKLEIDRNNLKP